MPRNELFLLLFCAAVALAMTAPPPSGHHTASFSVASLLTGAPAEPEIVPISALPARAP